MAGRIRGVAGGGRGDLGFTAVVREVEAADGDKGGKRWARVSLVCAFSE
jgi:hypothetical protein